MNVAVLTLTRDRLAYTKHCFQTLRENAGCAYTHFVVDQGSTDGTGEWLDQQPDLEVIQLTENIGINRAMNLLYDTIDLERFDVVVKFDNDCELTQPDTLQEVCGLALEGQAILSPRILGLNNPPASTGDVRIGDVLIEDVPQIGGIFLAAPSWLLEEVRYSEDGPLTGSDDVELCATFRHHYGGTCGYVKHLEAWHYETTEGQKERFPAYWSRKQEEHADARVRLR